MKEDAQLICPISYTDPSSLWPRYVGKLVLERLPLLDVQYKNTLLVHTPQSQSQSPSIVRIPRLPLHFKPSTSSLFKDTNHPFRWFLAPYASLYLVNAESLEAYKSMRAAIRQWVDDHSGPKKSQWLIVYITRSDQSPQIAQSLFERVGQDFFFERPGDRCVIIGPITISPTPVSAHGEQVSLGISSSQLGNPGPSAGPLMIRLREAVLISYQQRAALYTAEVNRLESLRGSSKFDFRQLFLVKESHALMCQMMQLPQDALKHYEELEQLLAVSTCDAGLLHDSNWPFNEASLPISTPNAVSVPPPPANVSNPSSPNVLQQHSSVSPPVLISNEQSATRTLSMDQTQSVDGSFSPTDTATKSMATPWAIACKAGDEIFAYSINGARMKVLRARASPLELRSYVFARQMFLLLRCGKADAFIQRGCHFVIQMNMSLQNQANGLSEVKRRQIMLWVVCAGVRVVQAFYILAGKNSVADATSSSIRNTKHCDSESVSDLSLASGLGVLGLLDLRLHDTPLFSNASRNMLPSVSTEATKDLDAIEGKDDNTQYKNKECGLRDCLNPLCNLADLIFHLSGRLTIPLHNTNEGLKQSYPVDLLGFMNADKHGTAPSRHTEWKDAYFRVTWQVKQLCFGKNVYEPENMDSENNFDLQESALSRRLTDSLTSYAPILSALMGYCWSKLHPHDALNVDKNLDFSLNEYKVAPLSLPSQCEGPDEGPDSSIIFSPAATLYNAVKLPEKIPNVVEKTSSQPSSSQSFSPFKRVFSGRTSLSEESTSTTSRPNLLKDAIQDSQRAIQSAPQAMRSAATSLATAISSASLPNGTNDTNRHSLTTRSISTSTHSLVVPSNSNTNGYATINNRILEKQTILSIEQAEELHSMLNKPARWRSLTSLEAAQENLPELERVHVMRSLETSGLIVISRLVAEQYLAANRLRSSMVAAMQHADLLLFSGEYQLASQQYDGILQILSRPKLSHTSHSVGADRNALFDNDETIPLTQVPNPVGDKSISTASISSVSSCSKLRRAFGGNSCPPQHTWTAIRYNLLRRKLCCLRHLNEPRQYCETILYFLQSSMRSWHVNNCCEDERDYLKTLESDLVLLSQSKIIDDLDVWRIPIPLGNYLLYTFQAADPNAIWKPYTLDDIRFKNRILCLQCDGGKFIELLIEIDSMFSIIIPAEIELTWKLISSPGDVGLVKKDRHEIVCYAYSNQTNSNSSADDSSLYLRPGKQTVRARLLPKTLGYYKLVALVLNFGRLRMAHIPDDFEDENIGVHVQSPQNIIQYACHCPTFSPLGSVERLRLVFTSSQPNDVLENCTVTVLPRTATTTLKDSNLTKYTAPCLVAFERDSSSSLKLGSVQYISVALATSTSIRLQNCKDQFVRNNVQTNNLSILLDDAGNEIVVLSPFARFENSFHAAYIPFIARLSTVSSDERLLTAHGDMSKGVGDELLVQLSPFKTHRFPVERMQPNTSGEQGDRYTASLRLGLSGVIRRDGCEIPFTHTVQVNLAAGPAVHSTSSAIGYHNGTYFQQFLLKNISPSRLSVRAFSLSSRQWTCLVIPQQKTTTQSCSNERKQGDALTVLSVPKGLLYVGGTDSVLIPATWHDTEGQVLDPGGTVQLSFELQAPIQGRVLRSNLDQATFRFYLCSLAEKCYPPTYESIVEANTITEEQRLLNTMIEQINHSDSLYPVVSMPNPSPPLFTLDCPFRVPEFRDSSRMPIVFSLTTKLATAIPCPVASMGQVFLFQYCLAFVAETVVLDQNNVTEIMFLVSLVESDSWAPLGPAKRRFSAALSRQTNDLSTLDIQLAAIKLQRLHTNSKRSLVIIPPALQIEYSVIIFVEDDIREGNERPTTFRAEVTPSAPVPVISAADEMLPHIFDSYLFLN